MKIENWKDLVEKMVDVYGVPSYFNNEPSDSDLWFECPECGEVIGNYDWWLHEVEHECPVCGYQWELD